MGFIAPMLAVIKPIENLFTGKLFQAQQSFNMAQQAQSAMSKSAFQSQAANYAALGGSSFGPAVAQACNAASRLQTLRVSPAQGALALSDGAAGPGQPASTVRAQTSRGVPIQTSFGGAQVIAC